MKCPVCAIELNMTERAGIEIDYCPQCRGVWLGRGELHEIIQRSTPSPAQGAMKTGGPANTRDTERTIITTRRKSANHFLVNCLISDLNIKSK